MQTMEKTTFLELNEILKKEQSLAKNNINTETILDTLSERDRDIFELGVKFGKLEGEIIGRQKQLDEFMEANKKKFKKQGV
jgi:hypothetical protein